MEVNHKVKYDRTLRNEYRNDNVSVHIKVKSA